MKNEREFYVKELRKSFSPKESIDSEGNLNHKYFHSKVNQCWSEKESEMLFKGIEEFGIGNFSAIKSKYLKNWSETEIKLRTGFILKIFNFDKFLNEKLNKEEIEELAGKNEEEGKAKNKFRHGIYFN